MLLTLGPKAYNMIRTWGYVEPRGQNPGSLAFQGNIFKSWDVSWEDLQQHPLKLYP